MTLKKNFKTYFVFSASERRSLLVLLTILLIVSVYPLFVAKDLQPIWAENIQAQEQLDSLLIVLQSKPIGNKKPSHLRNFFTFDPNKIDSLGLLSLGFSTYQAKNLLNYRRHGGCLKVKADLRKIYGMTDSFYRQLKPFVLIPAQSMPNQKINLASFDPNTIDSLGLVNLGFSRYQTNNILAFREKFGRFKKKSDLLRIYGIDSSDYNRYEEYIQIDSNLKRTKEYLFSFDPNNLDEKSWDSLGVEKRIVARINNFLTKGGRFRKPEDLKNIYGFDSSRYIRLCPYINIVTKPVRLPDKIDLNKADSIQFLSLPGIGPYFCKRILTYRESLGGFYDINQLTEIYGLKRSRVDSIRSYLFIGDKNLKRININSTTIDELSRHPYISYREASDIVRLRKRKSQILNLKLLRKKKIFSDSTFRRVKPYLILK